MNKRNLLTMVLLAIFGFSCVSGNLTGSWESQPDEDGKFRRWHFSELGEFRLEACKLKKGAEKPAQENELWKLILLWLLKREEKKQETPEPEENYKCVEIMKGEYKVTKYCDTTLNCILKPNHKVTLKSKGGFSGLWSKIAGPKELEFTRKGLKLTLGDEQLTRIRSKKFNPRDYF